MKDISAREFTPLARFAFYSSLVLFFYGILFPFHFDFSQEALSTAWSRAGLIPFWDAGRGRIHGIPDMISNILLTLPIGFFGFLRSDAMGKSPRIVIWGAAGLALGLLAEAMQLAMPYRSSDISDAINNCLGATAGAFVAKLAGREILGLLSGSLVARSQSYLWIVAGIVTAELLGPFDVSLDVSHFRAALRSFWTNPWLTNIPIADGWVQMVEFTLLGAVAGTIIRRGETPPGLSKKTFLWSVLLLPWILESAQLIVDSHAPALRNPSLGCAGSAAGLLAGLYFPSLARPVSGAILMNLALLAAGLSPYRFAGTGNHAPFMWLPLVEYYRQTRASTLYDAMTGLLRYALLGGLLRLAFSCPRWVILVWVVALSACIEFAQRFLVSRFPGTTDILIAALGGWVGGMVCSMIESRRQKSDAP